jgi:CubicO group peptidase (beta-lactamase class C family)
LRTIVVVGTTFSLLPVVTYGIGWVERRGTLSRKAFTPRVLAICAATVLLTTGPVTSRVDLFRGASDVPLPPSAAPRVVRIEPRREVTDFLAKSSPTDGQRIFELKSITEHFDSELGLGGTRVTVTTKEGHVWQVSVGTRPKSPSERSQIGSITKTFTATLVMQLVEEGKLSLDQAIGDLGMGFSHGRITLRQLLGHTTPPAGFSRMAPHLRTSCGGPAADRWSSSPARGSSIRPPVSC